MKPNIVIVMPDGLRTKDLSLYGYSKETDKNIKKIASESVVFDNAFSTSNCTYPSLTSLFSALYPTTSGMIHQYPHTPKQEIDRLKKIKFWLPIYLKNKGYNTISITPMYLWLKKGFQDITQEIAKEEESKFKKIYKKITTQKLIQQILLKFPSSLYRVGKRILKRDSSYNPQTGKIINLAIKKVKSSKKPFFLFMKFEDTHYPYPGGKTPNVKGELTKEKVLEKIKDSSQREYVKKRFYDANASSVEQVKSKKDNSVEFVDGEIGRLYEFLKKENLWKNTIFIIISDHGDSFYEHDLYFTRTCLYDETIKVPLIMYLPGIKGKRIKELVQNIDIAPTILDFMGEKVKVDGKSMIKMIKGGGKIRNEVLAFDGFCDDRKAIRTEKSKIISYGGGKCYLCGAEHGEKKEKYDLEKDPQELENIYSGKRQ